ncbi:MAG: hypothetical protein K8F90_08055 [Hyphomicrobiales bacterium]|nr:hypothetical protein [Hyphomicrobiales bacterium]
MPTFRVWCFAAAAVSLGTALLHVIGGGPEFHEPALASAMSAQWKAAFSAIWHEVTALLAINGLFLAAAGMTWRRNRMVLALTLALNAAFGVLFIAYGLARLGDVTQLLQWVLFGGLCGLIALAMAAPEGGQPAAG